MRKIKLEIGEKVKAKRVGFWVKLLQEFCEKGYQVKEVKVSGEIFWKLCEKTGIEFEEEEDKFDGWENEVEAMEYATLFGIVFQRDATLGRGKIIITDIDCFECGAEKLMEDSEGEQYCPVCENVSIFEKRKTFFYSLRKIIRD